MNTFRRTYFKRQSLLVAGLLSAVVVIYSLAPPAQAAVAIRAASTAENGAGSTSLTLNAPAGSATGDVLVAYIGTRGATTVTPPSGWTSLTTNASGTTLDGEAFSKTYSTLDSTYVFSLSANVKAAGIVVGYSGADTVSIVDVANSQANGSSTSMSSPLSTGTQSNTMLVAMYTSAFATTYSAGSSMTLRGQASSSGGGANNTKITIGAQDVIQAASGSIPSKQMSAANAAVSIGAMVAIRPKPVMEQNAYRFFTNTNSTTASTALAAVNTPIVIERGTPFRLRLNIGANSSGSSITTGNSFNLQFAPKGASCSTASYTTITADTSGVRIYDNATPTDATTYVTSGNDPTRSGVTAVGQYYEESNPFAIRAAIPSGQDGLWDFALTTDPAASYNAVYCVRAFNPVTQQLNTYSQYAELTIAMPTVGQANYRWLSNADNIAPGSALAAQDTAASAAYDTPVRLRERLAVSNAALGVGSESYKLQYAEKVGTCDVAFSGESYVDLNNSAPSSQTLNAGTVVEDTSYGSRAWSGAGSANVADGSSASANSKSSAGAATTYLLSSNHGFSIPLNATITNVYITGVLGDQTPVIPGFGFVSDSSIRIVKNGVIQGVNMANGFGWEGNGWGSTIGNLGVSLSPSDVNSSNFGVALSAFITGDNTNTTYATADSISITIDYTLPASSTIEYYDNPTPADGSVISSSANDPTNGARPTVYQTYRETDPFTNTNSIAAGSDGLWDLPIVGRLPAVGKTYCFRVVTSTGALLASYSQIPELSITGGGPTLDQQLRGGGSVINGQKGPLSW